MQKLDALFHRPRPRQPRFRKCCQFLNPQQIDPHGPILAADGEARSVQTKVNARDLLGLIRERQKFLPAGDIPKLGRAIQAAGGEPTPVGMKGNTLDGRGMSGQGG